MEHEHVPILQRSAVNITAYDIARIRYPGGRRRIGAWKPNEGDGSVGRTQKAALHASDGSRAGDVALIVDSGRKRIRSRCGHIESREGLSICAADVTVRAARVAVITRDLAVIVDACRCRLRSSRYFEGRVAGACANKGMPAGCVRPVSRDLTAIIDPAWFGGKGSGNAECEVMYDCADAETTNPKKRGKKGICRTRDLPGRDTLILTWRGEAR